MKSIVIFDLDGTLITCENKHKYVIFAIMNSNNRMEPEKLNQWWDLKRNGFSTERALIEMGYSDARQFHKRWVQTIENFSYCSLDKPFKDSLPSLKYLKTHYGSDIIILTARKSKYKVLQLIQRYGFANYLNDVIVVNPSSAVLEKAYYLKLIQPQIYIGDSETDYLAAINSNIRFIALSRGQRSRNFLIKYGKMRIEENLQFLYKKDFANIVTSEFSLIYDPINKSSKDT